MSGSRRIVRAAWLLPGIVLILLGGAGVARAATSTQAVSVVISATGAPYEVIPLSQHAPKNCYNASDYYICQFTVKNVGTKPINWNAMNEALASNNISSDSSTLYCDMGPINGCNDQGGGDYVYGTLKPGQKEIITIQDGGECISYSGYAPPPYFVFIVNASLGATSYAPQASILACY